MHRLWKILKYRLVPALVLFAVFIISSALLSSFSDASVNSELPAVSGDLELDHYDTPEPIETAAPDTTEPPSTYPPATEPPVTEPPDGLDTLPPQSPDVSPVLPETEDPHQTFVTATGEPIIYNYGEPVPESEPVDEEYFADAVFIGDSRTEGFKLYSGLKTADILAAKCISVDNIYRENAIADGNGEYVPIMEALSWHSYSKVYIMLGVNELGYDLDTFISLYSALIDNIRELQPDAEIYLQAIIPVSKYKDENDRIYTNERIRAFNERIAELAADKELFYIDTYSALCNDEGYLPEDASFDGVHLYKDYCVQWLDYLKTHTVLTSDEQINSVQSY